MINLEQYRAVIGLWNNIVASSGSITKLGKVLFTLKGFIYSLIVFFLILLSGDVHENPGPQYNGINIRHHNVRSLCPTNRNKKIDEIESILCIDKQIDIICLSETWLDNSILNEDINIDN